MSKKNDNNKRGLGDPAEFSSETTIDSVAKYELDKMHNPWNVQGMRDDMHYFFAAATGPSHSPQSVKSLRRMGYVLSDLKHDCPDDLVLMECKKDIVRMRHLKDLIQDQRNRKQSLEPNIPETHSLGGGVYRLPTHGMSKPR